MKLFKRILKILLCLLLAAVIAVIAVEGVYIPRYLIQKKPADITPTAAAGEVKIVSSNVRCWSPYDLGKKSWFYRASVLMQTVADANPDVIGFQEVTKLHYKYLCDCLPDYDSVITYRDDSPLAEACPVFYNTLKFELIDKGSFWLSETPDVPGVKGWDAACVRICSWAKLEDKQTGKRFVHFNTHLDHVGLVAMQQGALLVTAKAAEICPDLPAFFTGDFNVTPDSAPYRTVIEAGFGDARHLAADSDDSPTFHWEVFVSKRPKKENTVIDYCFVKGDVQVQSFRVLQDVYPGKLYPSDHYPVLATVSF